MPDQALTHASPGVNAWAGMLNLITGTMPFHDGQILVHDLNINQLNDKERRGFPIVGTNLDYFDFRNLQISNVRNMAYVGECVMRANVAERLDLVPGNSVNL